MRKSTQKHFGLDAIKLRAVGGICGGSFTEPQWNRPDEIKECRLAMEYTEDAIL